MQGVGIFFRKVDHGTRFGQIVVPVEIETGRDRNGTFESGLARRETILADTLECNIMACTDWG